MYWKTIGAALASALLMSVAPAAAEGELNIFNWGNYTSPEVIKKFEDEYKVKVTVTDYDSNDTALAKIKAGGHGFDIVVPSNSHVPVFIAEGLLLESRPDQMENFKNVDPRWVDVAFDPGRHYTIPWQWGTTGVIVNTDAYKGDVNTWSIIFDTPDELKGKVNVVPEMLDVMSAAMFYKGFKQCNDNKEELKQVRDMLVEAKKDWIAMEYGNTEKMPAKEFMAALNWNGSSMRARLALPVLKYGYPKEGIAVWMDSMGILKDAKNVENAKAFLNFMMLPENAALVSNFAKYANGIVGSDKFMPADFATAPEIVSFDQGRVTTVYFDWYEGCLQLANPARRQ